MKIEFLRMALHGLGLLPTFQTYSLPELTFLFYLISLFHCPSFRTFSYLAFYRYFVLLFLLSHFKEARWLSLLPSRFYLFWHQHHFSLFKAIWDNVSNIINKRPCQVQTEVALPTLLTIKPRTFANKCIVTWKELAAIEEELAAIEER